MIFLRIHMKGHFIEIPGLPPFRTPVEANITHISIPLVVSKLNEQGITDYEIVSEMRDKRTVLTNEDFVKNKKQNENKNFDKQEERIKKLEKMIEMLAEKKPDEPAQNQEQITNTLERIESLLSKKTFNTVVNVPESPKEKEAVVEDLFDEPDNIFVPSIDLDGFEVKGKSSEKTMRQDKTDINDSADLLSMLSQKNKQEDK